ncbi:MAG: ABC transporter ATP-binding protein [Spirochaetaceae bacterium]
MAVQDVVISIDKLNKIYESPAGLLKANNEISLSINKGDFIAVVGKSGSGKTTLINCITGIDDVSSGKISINGIDIGSLKQKELSKWRGLNVGVIFQFFQLLPTLTILENVMLPMELCDNKLPKERKETALVLLDKVGIKDQANKFPAYLSGGQKQRAAIARALVNDPTIICADEPTGNLDSETSDNILDIFTSLAKEGKTILMVTHERDISKHVNREIALVDGKVISDRRLS